MRWKDGFIAVDWGTTNRRAYAIDASGHPGDEFEDDKGIMAVPAGGCPAVVQEIRQQLGVKPLLLGGMVGAVHAATSAHSRRGAAGLPGNEGNRI